MPKQLLMKEYKNFTIKTRLYIFFLLVMNLLIFQNPYELFTFSQDFEKKRTILENEWKI